MLRCGTMMQKHGANTSRIRNSIDRIARQFDISAELFITHQAFSITLSDASNEHIFSAVKRTSHPGVNFRIVSGISRMSWRIKERRWTLQQIADELDRLAALPHFPRPLVLGLVGLAGSAFCGIADGSPVAMLAAFMATVGGLFIRQETMQRGFNPYFCVFFAALGATIVVCLLSIFFPGQAFDSAFATCVLFLIPGVPLINAFTDLLDGNILNGMLRAVNGMIISFMIALGFLCALYIFRI